MGLRSREGGIEFNWAHTQRSPSINAVTGALTFLGWVSGIALGKVWWVVCSWWFWGVKVTVLLIARRIQLQLEDLYLILWLITSFYTLFGLSQMHLDCLRKLIPQHAYVYVILNLCALLPWFIASSSSLNDRSCLSGWEFVGWINVSMVR